MAKITIPIKNENMDALSDAIVSKLSPDELNILLNNVSILKKNIKSHMRSEKIKSALDGAIPENVVLSLLSIIDTSSMTTPLRLAHFLSQCAHESGNFRHVFENLNYSAQGLLRVFPRYFGTLAIAKLYERKPVKIGSRVYANRMGNGDENSGDGFRFRGRGFIQLTGRNNYKKFSDYVKEDVVSSPDLVATKYPLTSALYYFDTHNLWAVADGGADENTIKELTRRINGGFNGLSDRINKFNTFHKLLKDIEF